MMYLKTSINHFQSITVSLPERDLLDAIKYEDHEPTKLGNELGNICKELYKECYYLLLNLAQKLNEKWRKDPTIYNKEILLNTDHVEDYTKGDEINWSLF